jgi:single-strand selective monofunctional uracil DNA glycosylase
VRRHTVQSQNDALVHAARRLCKAIDKLEFSPPVAFVYNPLKYAWEPHQHYLRKFGSGPKRVIFLGMNPGPFGMAQTGVPFGEIAAVRDWLKIAGAVGKPSQQHPLRPVVGFDCPRSEVSGQRLWNLFAARFKSADTFFEEHIVLNYCPLAFVESTGKNRTPDKLPAKEKSDLFAICDEHLRAAVAILGPEWLIGIGGFAAERARIVCETGQVKLGQILHPSPANPLANRNWSSIVSRELEALTVWPVRTL